MAPAFPGTSAPLLAEKEAETFAGLEPWIGRVPPEKRRLGLYLLAALGAHLALFWSIQIDTTPLKVPHAIHSHVTFEPLPGLSPAGRDQAERGADFWSDLTDPRLFLSRSPGSSSSRQGALPLDPLSELFPPFTALPSPEPALPGDFVLISTQDRPLAVRVRESLRPPRAEVVTPRLTVTVPTKTVWEWSDSLVARQPSAIPELPALTSDTELRPTRLRLAIDRDGAVAAVLIEPVFGEMPGISRADLDQTAVLAARKIRFAAAPSDVADWQWGTVTIAWYYTAPPREVVEPTPPSGP